MDFTKEAAQSKISRDHPNPHEKYNHPNIFNELRFHLRYPVPQQTVKPRKKDPSLQILNALRILDGARAGPMVLR